MALLRNRQVRIVSVTGGEDPGQLFEVEYKDGTREQVPMNELQFSEQEYNDFKKQNGDRFDSRMNKMPQDEYQKIVDSQDPEKIKKERERNPNPDAPVQVSKVMVDPKEIEQKSVRLQQNKAK